MAAVVLVIGGGGREHALAYALSKSHFVREVFVSPGNAGIALEAGVVCVPLDVKDHKCVVQFCKHNEVALVAIGPEAPLADGLSDSLMEANIMVFGPSKLAARLEYDKSWSKDFMNRHKITTAKSMNFDDHEAAKSFIKTSGFKGWAIKASGLAGGKGVIVTSDEAEALAAVDELATTYKEAAKTILIEERIHGPEISAMCFSDGTHLAMMPLAQDHKARYANNTGPNTGGMGAVCPYPVDEHTASACQKILQTTIKGMAEEGCPFKGVLYAGLMLCGGTPFVLEYNCRFGDPETQPVLSLLNTDLFRVMESCVTVKLDLCPAMMFRTDQSACAVVVVTKNYPASADKGLPITGLDTVAGSAEYPAKVYHGSTIVDDSGQLCTNGGRVVAVVVTGACLDDARLAAVRCAKAIHFAGASIREDIGMQAVKIAQDPPTGVLTYSDAGVDVALGERFVETIKGTVASTHGPLVLEGIGGFGALFDLHGVGLERPVLVAGTDGVGTKLMVANAVGRHDTIGQDLVAMCVNDILCHGALPLFFLDYLATGRLEVATMEAVVRGITKACKETSTALVGGETAEMPGLYRPGEYDVAGFAVGAVERSQILPFRDQMAEGDCLVGVTSSGIHSNGYSLVRMLVDRLGLDYNDDCPFDGSRTLGDVLLTPTRLYVDTFKKVQGKVLGLAHITGGGIVGNAARMLPDNLAINIDITKWPVQDEFLWLCSQGVTADQLSKTFNLGLGMIFVVRPADLSDVMAILEKDCAFNIGHLTKYVEGEKRVVINNLHSHLKSEVKTFQLTRLKNKEPKKRIRTAILISGRGSNMEAIVESASAPSSCVEVVLVLSNNPEAAGLQWAKGSGINTACVNHRDYKDRASFEAVVNAHLKEESVELVCLAGFMRILTADFVSKWEDALINIHPSILPSFKGKDAQKQALEAKVKITGCTVHYVVTAVDSGAILEQASVAVLPDDTVDTLSSRIRETEHKIFPKAVQSVAEEMLAASGPPRA